MTLFSRNYPAFALCGLNCGLCPRYNSLGTSRCPGCGGDKFNELHPTCPIITCSRKHENVEYCHECIVYPCQRYQDTPEFDSFITYLPRIASQQRALEFGIQRYRKQLDEKMAILERLIDRYDDGRRKGFYCLAVNLLNLDTLDHVMKEVETASINKDMDQKELAKLMVATMNAYAERQNISLRLRTNPKHV